MTIQMKIISLFCTLPILLSSYIFKDDKPITANQTEIIQTEIDRDSVISYSKQYLGIRYLYAGNNPKKGFDCSGFVNYVFQHFGITLPRSSSGYKNLGVALNPDDFKIGDILVFYGYKDKKVIGHVGIICEANGLQSKFIHASSGKAGSVTISELDSPHYSKRFYKCIDIISK